MFLMVSLAALTMRRKQPEAERPYRMPGGFGMSALAVAISLALLLLVIAEPLINKGRPAQDIWVLLLWMGLGFAIRSLRRGAPPTERNVQ
jgi:amino acid transporter